MMQREYQTRKWVAMRKEWDVKWKQWIISENEDDDEA